MAEASLAATRTQLHEAATQLRLAQAQHELALAQLQAAQTQRVGILSEVEQLLSVGLAARDALEQEVAALERRRDELLVALATPAAATAAPSAQAAKSAEVCEAVVSRAPEASVVTEASQVTEAPSLSQAPGLVETLLAADTVAAAHALDDIPGGPSGDTGATVSRPITPETGAASVPPISAAAFVRRSRGWLTALTHPALPGLSQIATGSLIALLLGLALLLTPVAQVFGGLQLLAVMSGSMEPTIPVGGVVGIRPVPATDLRVGDAITFVNQSNPDVLVTHRVVSIEQRDGQTMLTTKGDANDAVDALTAPASRAVGRVQFSLPWLGFLMVWLSSPLAKIGIVGLAVLGLGLTSVQRSSPGPPAPGPPATTDSYGEYEREIQALLGH